MSLEAIRIVQEEIDQERIECTHQETHNTLEALEARIVDRIERELVEIPGETITEKYSNQGDDLPTCQYCPMPAGYRGWPSEDIPLITGMRVFVCGEHRDQLRGDSNERTRMRDHRHKGKDPTEFTP